MSRSAPGHAVERTRRIHPRPPGGTPMTAVSMFFAALIFGPIWAYLTGFFGILMLWILAFFGHFLGIGALFTNFHWWTVLRWGYGFTAVELLVISAAAQ